MTTVKIVIAFTLFLDLIWTMFWLLYLGLDSRQMNRQIKDAEHPSPDELRNRAVMIGQLALMGLVNVMAGALAGIGSSLFVDGGRFRLPSSQVPYILIVIAASLTVFSGIIIGTYITRPAREWVWDTSDFRSYLRQVKREGLVSETELAKIRKRRDRWDVRTNVRPLRGPNDLSRLGLELRKAHEEWASSAPNDPVEFGTRLRADVTAKQVWRWIWRRRFWQLGVSSAIASCAVALIITGRLASKLPRLPILFPWLLLIALALICIAFVYLLAFRVGRLDLVMTNRYFALERKQLRDCDSLIGQIQELHRRRQEYASLAGADGSADKLVFRIGRWDLCRRNEEISEYRDRGRQHSSN
jgi:hypothetical protein